MESTCVGACSAADVICRTLELGVMITGAVARQVGLGWDLVNELALSKVREIVYDAPAFLDGVRFLGVDEHTWRHTRTGGANSVAILVDLTPAIDGTGPSRLLDMRPGRSAKVLTEWLDERPPEFKSRIEVGSPWTASPATRPPPSRRCLMRSR